MVQGESKPCIRNVFTLNTCANIVGAQVVSHMQERDLLEAWAQFVREVRLALWVFFFFFVLFWFVCFLFSNKKVTRRLLDGRGHDHRLQHHEL